MAARSDRDSGAGSPAVPSDVAICPLCGGLNNCAIARHDRTTPCWCVGQTFDPRLFERIASHDLGRRCVCPRCAFDSSLIAKTRRRPGA